MSLLGRMLLGLMIFIPGQVLGWDWRTRVTITASDQPLSSICEQLEARYGIHFSYSREIVDVSSRVTANIVNTPLRKALHELFSPYNIQFARIGEQIVLTRKAPPSITISGYVQDIRTGERLIGATIYAPFLQTGTMTNQYGFFSLTIPQDTNCLQVSYIGYSTQRLPISNPGKKQTLVGLQPLNLLREVIVTDTTALKMQAQSQVSALHISPRDVKAMPRLLGESDIMRIIASFPGVTGGGDGGSALSVRGGSPDQNLILLDGSPIFNAAHLFGLFSVFNPDIVKAADFYKGGFPAQYSGRLSSVIDIATKDGDMKTYHGEASAGLLAIRAMVEGPLKKDRTSFVFSTRRSILEPILNAMLDEKAKKKGTEVNLYFTDVNFKLNHIFSAKDRIYLSGYIGADHLGFTLRNSGDSTTVSNPYKEATVTRINWGNYTTTLRWNHVFSPKVFVNTTLNYSQYYFNTDYNYYYEPSKSRDSMHLYGKYFSKVQDIMLRSDAEFIPGPRHIVKFGAGVISHKFNPGVSIYDDFSQSGTTLDTTYRSASSYGGEVLAYAEDNWKITNALQVNAGLHISGFIVPKRFFGSFQPRIQVKYMFPHNITLKASYTEMKQYLHVLSASSLSLPMDLWVPSTAKVQPMASRQYNLGVSKNLRGYGITLEGYYKTMSNVIEYKEDISLFNTAGKNWDELVELGTGNSYGGEILLEKKKGATKGWIGYTLAWANRRFPNVNGGRPFPYNDDIRHDIEAVFTHQLNKRWQLSASWHFNSGMPITLPVASYEGVSGSSPYDGGTNTPILDHMSDRNQYRTRSMHRLDLSATHTKPKPRGSRSWTFSLFNAYNQQNPFLYSIITDRQKQQRYLQEISILPILPSVTYAIKF